MSPFGCHVVLFFICLLFAIGSSDELYGINNKDQEKAYLDMLVFDTDTNKLQVLDVSGFQDDQNTKAKGAAVICQDIYHSFWNSSSYTYPRALFSWRIVDNGPSYYQIEYDRHYVTVGCTSSQDTILLVETDKDAAVFDLSLARLYGTTITRTLIATLPDSKRYSYAYGANIFSFNADFSELWIALTDIKEGNGVLFIFDTKAENATNPYKSYSYPKGSGSPYFILPQTLSEGSFKGALKTKENEDTVEFVTLTINEETNELSVSVNNFDAPYLYGDGLPLTICGNNGYVIDAISPVGKDAILNAFDINTGIQTAQYNLTRDHDAPSIDIGGIACYPHH